MPEDFELLFCTRFFTNSFRSQLLKKQSVSVITIQIHVYLDPMYFFLKRVEKMCYSSKKALVERVYGVYVRWKSTVRDNSQQYAYSIFISNGFYLESKLSQQMLWHLACFVTSNSNSSHVNRHFDRFEKVPKTILSVIIWFVKTHIILTMRYWNIDERAKQHEKHKKFEQPQPHVSLSKMNDTVEWFSLHRLTLIKLSKLQ